VDQIISTWPLSEGIKTILENEKSRLAKLMQDSISNSKPDSLPKEAK
jgi:hypothetical protein